MMEYGPVIAVVDDNKAEVQGILDYLLSQNIGCRYFDANIDQNNYPEEQIKSVELVFLDLYYSSAFDPYQCAQWVDEIVPENQQYELVVWSRDSHRTEELLMVLREINKYPRYCITKQKGIEYESSKGVQNLLDEIEKEIKEIKEIKKDEFYAEIIDLEKDFVVLNCLIDEQTNFFQIRKFEKTPLSHFKRFDVGTFLMVKATTSIGERLFEFIEQFQDLSEKFKQKNIFEKFRDTPLIKKE